MLLTQPLRSLLLATHIASTVSVLGADLALMTLVASGLLGSEPRTIYPAARLIGANVVTPLSIASLVTGLLLALLTGWGLFRYWWVAIKLAITALLTTALLGVLLPSLGRAADAAVAEGPFIGSQPVLLFAAQAVASTLLVFALLLAVVKPGWRLRSVPAAHAAT
jgi:hypothetical protein